jgi:hypothetical protein
MSSGKDSSGSGAATRQQVIGDTEWPPGASGGSLSRILLLDTAARNGWASIPQHTRRELGRIQSQAFQQDSSEATGWCQGSC